MTRLLTTGWETGDASEAGGTVANTNTSQTVVTSTPTPRSPGTYCYKILATAGSAGGGRTWTLAASKTDLWIRFGYFGHLVGGTLEPNLCQFADSASGAQGTVTLSPVDQLIRVYRGAQAALLATSILTMSLDAWHTVEVRWQITSTVAGTVEVWVDGTRYINATSVDNTNTANANVQGVALGSPSLAAMTNGSYVAYDDFAVNDTSGTINNGQIGDGRVVLLKPNGAGSNTAQTRGGTDSGANWSQCDELPPSMTDYVYSATAATRDTYALEDIPSGSWSVNCVEALTYAANSDAGAGSIGLTVKSGATTNEGTAQAMTATAAYYRQLYETDPNTTAAWTNTAVNALEAGTTVR